MRNITLPLAAISVMVIFLSGCASYSASPLSSLASEIVISQPSNGLGGRDVSVGAKAFNKADCKKYLDRDVISEGYQPVQIYIQNSSEKDYLFALNRISVSFATPEEVAEKVHTSTAGRAAGYGVGALFLWPLAIPAIVDGVKSAKANEALDNDFSAKVAHDQIIFRHSHFNKLLFVPVNEYQPTFTITLVEQETNRPKKLTVTVKG
ncbi:MAG TPA: hypothetical protein VLE95_07805 [Chlamydiales bacterium]|nr:hypothetical protein [Chlamydiales bacterium]